ncbi:hypothetical protein [Serratia proteamaculans]|uniref:hypothetical protein n=1 Tax=Serratia proteamaculans TaxID=28151 RepID=UPI0021829061|nr:hypothetical protein [Serratia proteamaculans]CAI2439857.1 Uncharacterised protein [Serratia proteamaculans]
MTGKEQSPTHSFYSENISFLSGFEVSQEPVRLLPAADMIEACDIFLGLSQCHTPERWPRAKEDRREIARQVSWNLPSAWKPRSEWQDWVQKALDQIRQRYLVEYMPDTYEWQSWKEMETDLYVSVRCARQTIELFRSGNPNHLQMPTTVFLVPATLNGFFSSIIAGSVQPAWIAHMDAALTPGCCNGIYPKYQHL